MTPQAKELLETLARAGFDVSDVREDPAGDVFLTATERGPLPRREVVERVFYQRLDELIQIMALLDILHERERVSAESGIKPV